MSSDVCSICGSYECNESKCKIKNILKCLDEIKEQIEDIISEKCYKPCEECTGKPLCDKYYILQKIKEVRNG